ncbi:MAG: NAD-dependent epimerase/dehydratase family protein [Pseudonocardiales bacterium]
MRVAIVGATGNVGTALLRRLAVEPSVTSVTGLARRPPPRSREPYDDVDWVACDIGDPASSDGLRTAFAGVDAVVHLAWLIQPSHRPRLQQAVNVDGSGRVFRAARNAGVDHLVYASSVGAYAPDAATLRRPETWPVTGIPTSSYSRQKAEVEAVLDHVEAGTDMVVSRLRPGLIFQGDAGAQIARYFLGPLVPTRALALLGRVRPPVVPLPRGLQLQALHARDVADAYARVLLRRAGGAFNVAAEPLLDTAALAGVLGGRPAEVSPRVFRALAAATWQARLQPTGPGWLDLAMSAPLLDSTRAARVLDWRPTVSATDALRELVEGIGDGAGLPSPAMRPRDPAAARLAGLLRGRITGSATRT